MTLGIASLLIALFAAVVSVLACLKAGAAKRIAKDAESFADSIEDGLVDANVLDWSESGFEYLSPLASDVEGIKTGLDSLALTADEIKGRLVLEPTAKKQIAELTARFDALRSDLAACRLLSFSPTDGSGFYSPLACDMEKAKESLGELLAKQLPVHASHELLTALERKIDRMQHAMEGVRAGLLEASGHAAEGGDCDAPTETNIEFKPETEKAGFEAEDFQRPPVPGCYGVSQ